MPDELQDQELLYQAASGKDFFDYTRYTSPFTAIGALGEMFEDTTGEDRFNVGPKAQVASYFRLGDDDDDSTALKIPTRQRKESLVNSLMHSDVRRLSELPASLVADYEDKPKKAAKAAKLAKDKMTQQAPQDPGHSTKSHVVKACEGGKEKIVRFGQQGVKGAGKNPKTAKDKARKKSYYARHNAQDSNPDKMSARYWSHKVKW